MPNPNHSQLAGSAMLPYFKNLGITGDKYQSYGTVAQTPWAMKAAIGLISDTVPLFGYHKRSYIILVSILGSIAFSVIGFVQFSAWLAPLAAFLLLLGQLQLATVDLLCEGKYAEMMVSKPQSGSDLVTYVWGLYMFGTFIGSLVAGPIADHLNPRYIFIVCLPLAVQVIFPTLAGWLPEERLGIANRGIRRDKIRKHPDLYKLSIAMTIGAMAIGLAALLGSGIVQSGISVAVAFILCILGSKWLPGMLRKANLYMFLSSMLYVSLPGALDYWFTADEQCVKDGPHFSFTYYVTYASIVGSVAGAVGVAAFQTFLSRGNFRTAFWTTCIVKLAASFFDIFIVKRYNKLLGIPDKLAFLLGDAIIFQVASMLDFMPAVVLTSKVCPKGMEASVYALLASYQNLGANVSRTLGVALIDFLGIKTTVPCDFTKLPLAILIAHVLLPLLVFPLVFILIPDAKMTDDILGVNAGDGKRFQDFDRVPSEENNQGNSSTEVTAEKAKLPASDDLEADNQNNSEVATSLLPVRTDSSEGEEDSYIARGELPSILASTPGPHRQLADLPSYDDLPSDDIAADEAVLFTEKK